MRFRFAVAALAASLLPAVAHAQTQALAWGPAPAVFPAGAKMAVLQGDPSKPEWFTVRLDLPNGYRVQPHFDPTDELLTIISGKTRRCSARLAPQRSWNRSNCKGAHWPRGFSRS